MIEDEPKLSEGNLSEALRLLARTETREAPPELEQKLLAMFRENGARRTRRTSIKRGVWLSAAGLAAAAIAAGLAVITLSRPEPALPRPAPPARAAIAPPDFAMSVPVRHVATAKAVRRAPPKRAPEEMATEFFPLPYGGGTPIEAGRLVRVQVPRSAMSMVGLPVNPDRADRRVDADVLLGQDGLARAIRFVSSNSQQKE